MNDLAGSFMLPGVLSCLYATAAVSLNSINSCFLCAWRECNTKKFVIVFTYCQHRWIELLFFCFVKTTVSVYVKETERQTVRFQVYIVQGLVGTFREKKKHVTLCNDIWSIDVSVIRPHFLTPQLDLSERGCSRCNSASDSVRTEADF